MTPFFFRHFLIFLAFLALNAPVFAENAGREFSIGIHRIDAEIATTEATRMKGLMHRKYLEAQQGMLFSFPQNEKHCMWMRNTLIPLAVAFLDSQGKIINIEKMQPQSEENHCSTKPASYALEMNADWFEKRGIRAGQVLRGLENLPPAR